MYIFYCVFMSTVMSLIYEFSGLNGIKPANVFLSFLLFLFINMTITSPNVRYKRRIVIFYFIITILAICNAAKVRFQLAEISFFDVKLAKAAGDIAGLFLDKIPYTQIAIILVTFIVIFIFSLKYTLIFDNYKFSKEIYQQYEIEERWAQVDGIFSPIFVRIIPFLLLISFFIFTSAISKFMSTSSFGNLLISGKSMAENYYLETFVDKKDVIAGLIRKIKKDELSKVDANDPLLKGYPFNKQTNMDVVVIQSETFFDILKYQDKLEKNGLVIHDDTITQYFRQYQNEGISGQLYVPTVGGGTVNTEYEVLTGYGAKYFSKGSIVFTSVLKDATNSLPAYMKKYVGNMKTMAIHNHNADYWDRDRVYPLLDIDEFVDITQFTPEEQADLVGAWMSDKTIFDMTIRLLEKNPSTNNFILPVTVQNHGPFLGVKGSPIEVDNVTQKDGWEIRNYVANIKYSDEQLKIFMDYINSRTKPTMIVFYGDHKPDPNYDMFKNSPYYNENERINVFSTDYFVWFNNAVQDPKLLALKGTKENISSASLNRYIQMLLGDDSPVSMYIYNYEKNPENYYNKNVISGVEDSLYRQISTRFINNLIDYTKLENTENK
ncbi:Phosphoglycerol transferase MdoB [[Eubacterium] yurii]|nr:Phosphoglycerol transferase MdoB [[Eubacterium] yurii]